MTHSLFAALLVLAVCIALFVPYRKYREQQKHFNKLRKEVSYSVLASMENNETPEQFEQRIKSVNNSALDLKQFGQIAFSTAVQLIKQDNRLTPTREKLLEAIVSRFEILPTVVKETEPDLSRGRVLYGLDQGNLPEVVVPGLVLLKGETAYWSETGAILEERVVNRQYVGGSSGVSVRIMKGVYLRGGGFRGHIESQKGIVPVSSGSLVLTNHRLIFHGDNKSMDTQWEKLLDVEFFKDGVRFSISHRSKPITIQFSYPENTEIVQEIVSHIVSQLRK